MIDIVDIKGKVEQGKITAYVKDGSIYLRNDIGEIVKIGEVESDDAISRQAVEEIINDIRDCISVEGYWAILERMKKLPSVNQQPKTGHWEWEQYYYYPERGNWHCSECKCVVVECVDKDEKGGIPLYKYCPQCGIKIIKPRESEERA